MSEYVMIVKHDNMYVLESGTDNYKMTTVQLNYIAKRCPGRQDKFVIISEFRYENDARFALDALNEKHNFEYVTNKDSEAK